MGVAMCALCDVSVCVYSDGQVGVGSVVDITTPTILSSLSSQVVKAVACGDNHTAVLTEVSLPVSV